jgi:thiaminase
MTFIEDLWQKGKPVLDRMISHPFNQQLASGTLPLEIFHCYLQQDELYIREYTQVLFTLLQRTDDRDLQQDLQRFATEGALLSRRCISTFLPFTALNQLRESLKAVIFTLNSYTIAQSRIRWQLLWPPSSHASGFTTRWVNP